MACVLIVKVLGPGFAFVSHTSLCQQLQQDTSIIQAINMHNLHFQGLVDEAILIDAPTQDVTLFCLLCLPVTFSWIMFLTSLLFIRSVTEVLWSAQLCCYDASVFVMFFPTCFSCLIDFCNPMNSCINMALFQRQVTQPF